MAVTWRGREWGGEDERDSLEVHELEVSAEKQLGTVRSGTWLLSVAESAIGLPPTGDLRG